MSTAEQLEDPRGGVPMRRDALIEQEAFIETQLTEPPAKTRARLRPLIALAPYVARYRGRAILAFVSLTVAAITTLVVPIAVRRMIDFGFSRRRHRPDQQLFQRHDRGRRGAALAPARRATTS